MNSLWERGIFRKFFSTCCDIRGIAGGGGIFFILFNLLLIMKDREKDLTLIKAIKNGDRKAWEDFVSLYSDVIFNSIRHWCQPYCRNSHQKYLCPWKINSKSRMDLSIEHCGEMLNRYLFAL